jgi:hypothetical protein
MQTGMGNLRRKLFKSLFTILLLSLPETQSGLFSKPFADNTGKEAKSYIRYAKTLKVAANTPFHDLGGLNHAFGGELS